MKTGIEYGPGGLIGVVLCGGESRRMGRDKGLIETDGVSWAERIGRQLSRWRLPVVYSIRSEQEEAYSVILPEACRVADTTELAGPLNGLYSVHHRFPESDLLVLACDMQDMDEWTIGELIADYGKGGAEFYVFYEGGFAQPFCAVYSAAGLRRVYAELGGERRLRGVIERGLVRRLEVKRVGAFANHNIFPDSIFY